MLKQEIILLHKRCLNSLVRRSLLDELHKHDIQTLLYILHYSRSSIGLICFLLLALITLRVRQRTVDTRPVRGGPPPLIITTDYRSPVILPARIKV
jgi:hypothetical protein